MSAKSRYTCLACNTFFFATGKAPYVRHQKYGGCTWGIGKRTGDADCDCGGSGRVIMVTMPEVKFDDEPCPKCAKEQE